ncbi:YcdB/YcdC domain-containing protein [Brevibacillus laterosporus]|uniref:YcdB/YcdC domain-containing protein n=1 Tax=Brevibacillus laterosporus TaxID=1465 RepID=UPI00265289DD|nr:YcdB/YcdC domain-containing protein [Brevibacillus laterosporus]MDN9008462.1 S-layer homology domain-containing protein [Brevibacillus laterosporus]MDO0939547.1 S-layer homology domain-containing protein [Brevibacillus laterosporus]
MNRLSLRKWIAAGSGCVLAAGMLLAPFEMSGSASVLYAQEKKEAYGKLLTQKEVEERVKQWITIPADYKLRNSRLEIDDEQAGSPYWSISWETSDKNNKFINASVNAQTGELIGLFKYTRNNKTVKKAVNEKEAEKTAWAFIEKVAKSKKDSLSKANEIVPLTNNNHFTFVYTRMSDEIPFLENGVTIEVDADGEITSYNLTWDEGKIPSPKAAISLEQAEKTLKGLLDPQVQYMRSDRHKNRNSGDVTYTPVYIYGNNNAKFLDANSGEAISSNGRKAETSKKITPLGDKITFTKNQTLEKIGKDQAEQIAMKWAERLGKGWVYNGTGGTGSSVDSTGIKTLNWSFRFISNNQSSPSNEEEIRIKINDKGQFQSFSKRNDKASEDTKGKKAIDKKEAEKVAIEMIKSLYPDHTGQMYLKTGDDPSIRGDKGRSYIFTFGYLYKDTPIDGRDIEVEVNKFNNEVTDIWLYQREDGSPLRSNNVFETIQVSKKEAIEKEIKEKKAMLTYYKAPFYIARADESVKESSQEIPIQLVYRYVGNEKYVNAATGELIEPWGFSDAQSATDIEGHKSEEALGNMLNRGLFFLEDGKLEPDKEISRAQFVALMVKISNELDLDYRSYDDENDEKPYTFSDVPTNHPYYAAISQASQFKIIPSSARFEPDRAITRYEAIEMFMQTLQFGSLLSKSDIFQSPYPDVEREQVPAYTLAYALGYMSTPKGTKIEPNKNVTRAEAADLIYQFYQQYRH